MDYEVQYNNRARVPEHPAIMGSWATDAAAYRAVARMEAAIPYGESEREKLDLFLPEGEVKAAALFIHGGYWQALDRSSASHLAKGLSAHGFAVAVPSYDLCPIVSMETIVEQMRKAVAATAARLGKPLLVIGHSAGGHLAACMLATDWKQAAPDLGFDPAPAGYAISGLFDLPPLVGTSVNIKCGMTPQSAEALSPMRWPAPSGKHLVAVVGGEEPSEYQRQSREMAETWGKAGVTTAWRSIPGDNHFTVIAPLADPRSEMVAEILALAKAAGLC